MSAVLQFEFRLFGARRGQTVWLNNHLFRDGICILVQSSDNMGTAARVLSFYGAYHRGSPEYDAALVKEQAEDAELAAKEAAANGADEVHQASVAGIDPAVEASVQPDGGGSPNGEAVPGAGNVGAGGTDPASAGTSGDGYEHAGVPKFPEGADYRAEEPASSVNAEVAAAVRKLDPDVDAHWVQTGAHKGKPKLQAVEDAYGKAGLTRQDIEAASPHYDRAAAAERALA